MTPAQQKAYDECMQNGCSTKLAEMLALQLPPMSNSDRELLEGTENGRQFERTPRIGDFYAREARRHGVDITGAVYKSGLAAYPGDPRAWVRGRGDVQRICEERGWECSGSVNVNAVRLTEPKQKPLVADDIINDEVEAIVDFHPDPKSINVPELKEKIYNKRKPKYKGK